MECDCIFIFSGIGGNDAEWHGMKNSKMYQTLKSMKNRCFSSNNPLCKKYYRDKGIGICKQWSSFAVFYRDMGDKPSPDHSIDRIDNSKGYCPHNCRWATKKEQSLNRDCVKKRKESKVKSKYPGVNKQTKADRWYSQISINGKKKYLGSFKTEEEAFDAFKKEYFIIHSKKHKLDT